MEYSHGIRPPPVAYATASFYPRIDAPAPFSYAAPRPPLRQLPSQPSSSLVGIRVTMKPECWLTPPPPMIPVHSDIPRTVFSFNFDLEHRILSESESWSPFVVEDEPPHRNSSPPEESNVVVESPPAAMNPERSNMSYEEYNFDSDGDTATTRVTEQNRSSETSNEIVSVAILNYGSNPEKVAQFVEGHGRLVEMGFPSGEVVEALLAHDSDADKAVAQFLNR